MADRGKVNLKAFANPEYDPGAGLAVRILWFLVNAVFLQGAWNPSSALKVWLLRRFGARVGEGVVIKPSVNVKYPWYLEIGDHTWIGENAWLDNLAPIRIGSHCCLSQGVYLCTGNHDWSDPAFGLITGAIELEDGAWVGAKAVVLPGVKVGSHSILTAGSVATRSTEPYQIYQGNPARPVKERQIGKAALPAQPPHPSRPPDAPDA